MIDVRVERYREFLEYLVSLQRRFPTEDSVPGEKRDTYASMRNSALQFRDFPGMVLRTARRRKQAQAQFLVPPLRASRFARS